MASNSLENKSEYEYCKDVLEMLRGHFGNVLGLDTTMTKNLKDDVNIFTF